MVLDTEISLREHPHVMPDFRVNLTLSDLGRWLAKGYSDVRYGLGRFLKVCYYFILFCTEVKRYVCFFGVFSTMKILARSADDDAFK